MKTTNLMIVGVGGQGSLLASKLLGRLLLDRGFDVKVSEVHGMSQRGGSVVTYVRFGDAVCSPIICEGEADYIISFEKLEAARYAPFLREGGRIVVNAQQISPMPVIVGQCDYPSDVLTRLREKGAVVDEIDALGLAVEAGSPKAVNLVLLGHFARRFADIPMDAWQEAIRATVPPRFLDMNLRAFDLGFHADEN